MTMRAERLRNYIGSVADVVPQIGLDDCGPWAARWVEQETGRAVNFPIYTTREEGDLAAAQAGGLVKLANKLLAAIDVYPTPAPELGDICIIGLSKRDTAGIMCAGNVLAVRGEERGVIYLNAHRIKQSWSIPNGD